MSQPPHTVCHRRLMMALFFLLFSIYMLTYSGRLQFNDELQMLDVTGSLIEFGDKRYDLSMWYVWTNYGPLGQNPSLVYPLPSSPLEPMQSIVGMPFYILAQSVPGIGIVHAVWLVNAVVCAGIGVLLFRYALLLGYDERTAMITALLLGVGTLVWPYSRTFFREPLVTLLVLLSAYWLECARRQSVRFLFGALVAFVMAYLTKESVLMLLPALLAVVFPPLRNAFQRRPLQWVSVIGLTILILFPVVLTYTNLIERVISDEIPLTDVYSIQSAFAREALHTYLFSIGGSVWGTSPIVLLALPGVWMLYRSDKTRYAWVAILSVIGLTGGHALTTGEVWFGGATWPPRFIIPALPFLMLAALPVVHTLRKSTSGLIIVVPLLVYSLWWQISGVAFPWSEYSRLLPANSNGLAEWGAGLNTLRYMRPAVLLDLWFNRQLDFAWLRADAWLWPLLYSGLGIASIFVIWRRSRYVWLLPVGCIVFIGFGLYAINDDPLYLGTRDSLHQVMDILDQEEQARDVVLLNSPQYHWFFLNHTTLDDARVVSLPLAPGERGSFEEKPDIVFDDAAELLNPATVDLIHALAAQRERLWLLMDAGPFLPWRIRPVERFMADAYYPIRELHPEPSDPTMRLLEFNAVRALPFNYSVVKATDLVFGESIAAASFMLPEGDTYSAGVVLPVTVFWQTDEPLEQNYNVALFLARDEQVVFVEGAPVQGQDTPPAYGFAPMPEWEPGEFIKDNRVLRLPESLPAGEYQLLLRLYTPESGGQEVLPVSGANVMDDGLATLPVTIIIE